MPSFETTQDLRCPEDPRRLFAKVRAEGQRPKIVPGNLIEFSCKNCRKRLDAFDVLHRYNILGEFIETEVKPWA